MGSSTLVYYLLSREADFTEKGRSGVSEMSWVGRARPRLPAASSWGFAQRQARRGRIRKTTRAGEGQGGKDHHTAVSLSSSLQQGRRNDLQHMPASPGWSREPPRGRLSPVLNQKVAAGGPGEPHLIVVQTPLLR